MITIDLMTIVDPKVRRRMLIDDQYDVVLREKNLVLGYKGIDKQLPVT